LRNIIPAVPSTSKGKSAAKAAKSSLGRSNTNANKVNPVFAPSKSSREEKKKSARSQANYCILLYVPEEARWRICHENQQEVAKLQLKVVYSVLRIRSKAKAGLMESFLGQIKAGSVEALPFWTWENQNKWGGKCQSNNLQSPINISRREAVNVDKNFGISMHLTDVQTLVKKNFNEIIVTFLKFGGVLKLTVENTYLLFTPQFMSFRFPGESIVDGKRSQGDILLHFAELSSERKTATTNGLVLTIPIEPAVDALNMDNLDHLNMEFWRYEILKHGTYVPKRFLKKQLLDFSLEEFSNKFMELNPNFYMYYGSSTTPPCNENVIHIVVDKAMKIPGCQFKLLRENSLVSSKPKEIHARVEKPANERVVYRFDKKRFGYIPSLVGVVPQSFNKYLLAHGPSYMLRLFYRYGAKYKGGKYARWYKKHGKKYRFRVRRKPWWIAAVRRQRLARLKGGKRWRYLTPAQRAAAIRAAKTLPSPGPNDQVDCSV